MKNKERYIIETVNLVKIYKHGKISVPALRGVNLEVSRGEFIAVVGPSGSGKSTLLHLIGGLDTPTKGEVIIDGINITKLDGEKRAEIRQTKIGFVFQSYNLIQRMSAIRNVELPLMLRKDLSKDERRKLAMAMLDAVGLKGKYDRRPTELSGGEQQRVAIARALVTKPLILLGDEITGNIDTKTALDIISLLKQLNKKLNVTIVLVTHNMDIASFADRIVYLRDGLIVKEEVLS